MKVAMVKHGSYSKVYWFDVPDDIAEDVVVGVRVICDTARGQQPGLVVGTAVIDPIRDRDFLVSAGGVLPLRQIVSLRKNVPIADIKIPDYMKHSKPRDEKIAKRFLEYYHSGSFSTNVSIRTDGALVDGYSAYMVAKMMNLPSIWATVGAGHHAER